MNIQSQKKLSRRETMFGHIENWQSSGKSQNRYCKENELSISTFSYWLKQYRTTHNESPEQNSFIPLTVADTLKDERRFEMELPDGVTIRIYY
jgi:hypothetical protein